MENIDFLLLRYLNTGVLPAEEFSEEWLHKGEVKSFCVSETVSGIVSIWGNVRR